MNVSKFTRSTKGCFTFHAGAQYDPLVPWSKPEIVHGYAAQCKEFGCVDVLHAKCHSLGFFVTAFPTSLGYTSMQEALDELDRLAALIDSGCSRELQWFACTGIFHPESLGPAHQQWPLPCRSVCDKIWTSCRIKADELLEKRPEVMKCHFYPKEHCISGVYDTYRHENHAQLER